MPRTRPAYPVEFRRETVQLVREGRTIADVAKSLGVSQQTLRNWCNQTDVDAGRREGLGSDEREELKQLRARERWPKKRPRCHGWRAASSIRPRACRSWVSIITRRQATPCATCSAADTGRLR